MKKNKMANVFFIIVFFVCLGGICLFLLNKGSYSYEFIIRNDKMSGATIKSKGNKYVAYIPLDDRPVNTDRVKYLAQSIGYTLVMPSKDYYSTKLDGNGTNANGTKFGNTSKLYMWLDEMEKNGCDYYIISLDQLFSGGLVNSRIMTERSSVNNDIYINKIKDTFEKIINDKSNKVYIFDSIMRLAPTVDYMSFDQSDYDKIYDYASIDRKKLYFWNLTIDNIYKGYKYDKNGKFISHDVSLYKIMDYLNARYRKLKLIDYYVNVISGKNNVEFFVGIDDSSNGNSIQTNEIAYIKKILRNYDVDTIIRDGIDEYGMVLFTKLVSDNYDSNVKIKTTYYGGSEFKKSSVFASQSIVENYEYLINILEGKRVKRNPDISVLIFTNPLDEDKFEQYAIDLINQYISNINNKIPTIIIDASSQKYGKIFESMLVSNAPLGYLIGYSSWNDSSNSEGIALSEGIIRYLYLSGNTKSYDCDIAFLKLMATSYIKDMIYKGYVAPNMSSVKDNDLLNKLMSKYTYDVIDNLKKSNYISNLNGYNEKSISSLELSNYRFPWNRNFEMSFDVNVKISNSVKNIKVSSIESDSIKGKRIYYPFINSSIDFNGKFRPDDRIQRNEIAKWICKAENLTLNNNYYGYFTDVYNRTVYWKYIETATKYGYFNGSNGKFYPTNYMTRAELVSLVVQIAERKNISLEKVRDISFTDVKAKDWYYNKVKLAADAGLINGYTDGSFKPNAYCSRAEAAAILIRLYSKEKEYANCNLFDNINPFSDVDVNHWAYNYLIEAYYEHSCYN